MLEDVFCDLAMINAWRKALWGCSENSRRCCQYKKHIWWTQALILLKDAVDPKSIQRNTRQEARMRLDGTTVHCRE